jgi:hypothetical protein
MTDPEKQIQERNWFAELVLAMFAVWAWLDLKWESIWRSLTRND